MSSNPTTITGPSSAEGGKKDHWSAQAYNSAAGFVPKLTTKVLAYLDPQPHERILDIGCGDGQLTAQIAAQCSEILGVDSSASFIASAKEAFGGVGNCAFELGDAVEWVGRETGGKGKGENAEGWDKVFSNAAMHWILRRPATRRKFLEGVHARLRSGGVFVFEMGGKGNVAEIQAAATAALMHAGLGLEEAREASPWFFPSENWMRGVLEGVGFEVLVCEMEYRPSRLESTGGLEGWVRLMCAEFLEAVGEEKREGVVKEICDVVEGVVSREEDGSRWLGYVRLRAVARKR